MTVASNLQMEKLGDNIHHVEIISTWPTGGQAKTKVLHTRPAAVHELVGVERGGEGHGGDPSRGRDNSCFLQQPFLQIASPQLHVKGLEFP